jgi:hypothetical protein
MMETSKDCSSSLQRKAAGSMRTAAALGTFVHPVADGTLHSFDKYITQSGIRAWLLPASKTKQPCCVSDTLCGWLAGTVHEVLLAQIPNAVDAVFKDKVLGDIAYAFFCIDGSKKCCPTAEPNCQMAP